MKIECTACSKKYDAAASSGVCPYCGMPASEEQLTQAQENEVIKSGSVKEMLRSYLNERLRQDKKTSPLRNKKVQLTLCTLLVAAMIGVALWGKSRYDERLKYYEQRRDTSDMQVVRVAQGDSIVLLEDEVRLVSCRVLTEYQNKVEGGFKLIEIGLEDSGLAERTTLSSAYIITENGCTAKCIDVYYLATLMGSTEEELKDKGYIAYVSSTGRNQRGEYKLVFAVPENETEHRVCLFGMSDPYAYDKKVAVRYEYLMKEGE